MYTALAIMSSARSNRYFRAAIEDDLDYGRLVALRQKVLDTEMGLSTTRLRPPLQTARTMTSLAGWMRLLLRTPLNVPTQ